MEREASRARSIDLYGVSLLKSRDEAGARRCFEQAHDIIESAYGPISPHLAMILSHQGDVLRLCARDPAGARLRYLKALAILRHSHGFAHREVVETMVSIGYTLVAEKQLSKARRWFERAAAVGRSIRDRDNPVLIIPDLLRSGAGYWMTPEAYDEALETELARITRIYGTETAPVREAQQYLNEYVEKVSDYGFSYSIQPVLTLFFPVVGVILAISYYAWTLNGSVSPVRSTLLPFLIGLEALIWLRACLQVWARWRARHGRPLGLVRGAEQEIAEFESLQSSRLGFDSSPFRSPARAGDNFALVAKADIHLLTGQYAKAAKQLTRIAEAQPGEASILRRRALSYLGLEETEFAERAIWDLQEAVALDPGSRFALLLLSRAFNAVDRAQEAVAAASRALELGYDDAEVRYERGVGYSTADDHAAAEADLSRAIEFGLEPKQPALVFRGLAYLRLDRHEEGLADLSEVLGSEPGNAAVLALRGMGYRLAGQYDKAIADLTQAIELDPGLDEAFSERSQAYRAISRFDAALADVAEAIARRGANEADNDDVAELIAQREQIYRDMGAELATWLRGEPDRQQARAVDRDDRA